MKDDPRNTFFPKRKVRVELTTWHPKMNAQGEKRVELDFMLPLIDKARDAVIPAWIIAPLAAMESEDAVQGKTKLEIDLEGVTLELWDTPTSTTRAHLLSAATLTDFFLANITRDKQTFPALIFSTNVARAGMLSFCDRYEAKYLWAEFTPADPDKKSPPAPGMQMTLADQKSAAAGDREQTPEEATANLRTFKGPALTGRDQKTKDQVANNIAEANRENKANQAKAGRKPQ
jgi:hypothetical protein